MIEPICTASQRQQSVRGANYQVGIGKANPTNLNAIWLSYKAWIDFPNFKKKKNKDEGEIFFGKFYYFGVFKNQFYMKH